MLTPICDDLRLILGIVATLGGILFAIMSSVLKNDLRRFARSLFHRAAEEPSDGSAAPAGIKASRVFNWILLVLSFVATVGFGPYVAAVPSKTCVDLVIAEILCNPEGDELTGEYVRLENLSAGKVRLNQWTLCDYQSRHCYTFLDVVLAPHASLTLWTQPGNDTATDLYFGATTPIWTNDEDTAYLYDIKGQLIHQLPCP